MGSDTTMFRTTDEEIRSVLRYMPDPRKVSQYIQQPLRRVERIAREMADRKPDGPQQSQSKYVSGVNPATYHINDNARALEAKQGSDALRTKMFRLYERVANDLGLANEWQAAAMLGMRA